MLFGKHINRYYLRYLHMILIGLAALLTVDFFQLRVPALYQLVINGLNDGEVLFRGETVAFNMDFLLKHICNPLLLVILVMVTGRFIWRICFFGSGVRAETALRKRMYEHCVTLSQEYYQENKVGGLMALFTGDLDTIQECFGWGVMMTCDALFLGILSMIKMFRMDVGLAFLSIIPMLLLLAVGAIISKYMSKKWEYRQEKYAQLSDFAQENFSGISVIKAFVKEGRELLFFKKLNMENEKANVDFTRASVALRVSVTLFIQSVIAIILGYGGWLVYKGTFNAGRLVEYIGYFSATVWPIMAVSELIEMRSRGKASLKRISALLDARPRVVDAPGLETPRKPIGGKIEFRHLSFAYPGEPLEALHDISVTIAPGQHVGIIGRTGAGKTTLVDLILRTYNVPRGTLFLDDRDVNDLPIRHVRQGCAYVPQDNFLFSDTIENNIAFAADDPTREGVERAAKLADVHENITEFARGYETVLGERGVTVSGGQKQRISIARALWKNAPILILDDSVSAVDVNTEKVILENLRQERQGKTTILIAHRVSTIEKMDLLLFLDEGRLAAAGTHAQLMETCPPYRHMVELQRIAAENEEKEDAEHV